LSDMFDGDWALVLAAYNGGPGRVSKAIKRSGTDDFWKLSATTKYLPRETREYVPLVMAAMIIGRSPEQYGFEVANAVSLEYEKVTIPQAIDLRRVAEWTGTTVDEIQALNPELRRWTTPVKYPDYEMKVPKGTAERLTAKLADASPADFVTLKWYTAKSGDTLLSVGRKFGVSRADVAEANNLSVKARLYPGQALIIPRQPATIVAARADRPAPSTVASRAVTSKAEAPVSQPGHVTAITYHVKQGDTLSSIAQVYDTTVAKIKSWNHLTSSTLRTGTRLKIYASHPSAH